MGCQITRPKLIAKKTLIMGMQRTTNRIDLTAGPILKTLVRLAVPVTISMVMFTVYLMADLYFVGRLGPDAVAALSIAGNAFFIHLGFSTILGTGGMALIAQAFGRKDYDYAATVFKQSILLALIVGMVEAIGGLMIAPAYIKFFGGSGKSLEWGIQYFQIFVISFFFMILLYTIGNCYRGMGNTKTPMMIMLQANIINISLDPILIYGWLGIPAMGVRGAAVASVISQIYALGIYGYFIFIKGAPVELKGKWQLHTGIIQKSLIIGIPSGLNHFLLAANLLITYRVVSEYGTAALAAIGIGFRILQTIYIPVIAVASAMAAIVGQNFGANKYHRITGTFARAWSVSMMFMLFCTAICQAFPEYIIGIFSNNPHVMRFGIIYLKIFSLGFVMVGTIMVFSAVFQGLGKTYPSLVGAVLDNALFAAFVFSLPVYFSWGIQSIWWIKLTTAIIEMIVVALWLKSELQRVRSSISIKRERLTRHT
ncbi:Multi antimicrobial extrusion protein (Na(+)/drug antiporter), MATE family of MDR efflux pumps [Olavius sp. associated proteobacterium Delta 1]|nr:Multi antimicrobial extrusion protein (Na(+)/drug antiporter), MATE family of MDR efflux pumps [Olavius sp. associated proteobacterium Delta 1]